MSKAAELTNANFDTTVAQGVALVDFWAEWCGPCRMMSPVIDELVGEYTGKVTVGAVNVDNEGDLAQRFGVSSIPTFVIIKDGTEVKRFVGARPKGDLVKALNEAVK